MTRPFGPQLLTNCKLQFRSYLGIGGYARQRDLNFCPRTEQFNNRTRTLTQSKLLSIIGDYPSLLCPANNRNRFLLPWILSSDGGPAIFTSQDFKKLNKNVLSAEYGNNNDFFVMNNDFIIRQNKIISWFFINLFLQNHVIRIMINTLVRIPPTNCRTIESALAW